MSETLKAPAVDIAVRTDPGRDPDKQVNEDASAHLETPLGLLFVVCDGMGGHAGGKEASELAVATIIECVKGAPPGTAPRDALGRALEEANARVFAMPTGEPGMRPGSTVVAVLAHEGGAEIAHVGDSRVYLVHAGAITQVTRDHSMVQEMVDRNLIRAEDAASHPDANKILRALGISASVEVDVRATPIPFVAGDVFILCSDGLSDLVGPAEILEIAGSHPPQQAAGRLVDLANARGGHDNITALVLRMKSSASATAPPTIVKTAALTAHDAMSGAPPSSSGGEGVAKTLLSAPLGSAPVPATHVAPPHVSSAAHAAPGPVLPRDVRRHEGHHPHAPRSKAPIIVGLVLALAASVILGTLLWLSNRPQRHQVPIVVEPPREAGVTSNAAAVEDEAGAPPEPAVTQTPPLESAPPPPRPHHHHRDGGAVAPGTAKPRPQPTPTPTPPPAPSSLY